MKEAQSREHALNRCKELGVVIPTLAQQRRPQEVPAGIQQALESVDMQKPDPLNLFRITWKNNPGGKGYGPVNAIEIPPELSGVKARIIGLVGRHFPTGAHKVGAAFGCLVPRLVDGEFDPTRHVAVWPSTGNYCRGGAFDSALLGCKALAILPEEMSQERFRWLESIGAEVLATPGCESNVKEIFDACWDIRGTRGEAVIFNQFEEFGNYQWHYAVTGDACLEVYHGLKNTETAWWVGSTGSGGTLATGDRLKREVPGARIIASEALQCPTLLMNGYGGHRIEGIGDKHVPWIHNVRNTDGVCAIDDEDTMRIFRLFNEPAGLEVLIRHGIPEELVTQLQLLGLSSICNLLSCIKTARWFDLGEETVLFTSFTDAANMYESRLEELNDSKGAYTSLQAELDLAGPLLSQKTDFFQELCYPDRKKLHHLKYFTWVEQQGKTVAELDALWDPGFWRDVQEQIDSLDEKIVAFNRDSGATSGVTHA
jgi:cysteine synthase A